MDTMTENDYLIAWGLYAFAALGCLLVWMRMTRFMWRWLREPLRVLMAVLLFSPTIIDPVKEQFAPAVAITALDLAFKVGNNAIVGGSADISVGAALYKKINRKNGVVICNIGDGSMACGPVWEGLMMATMDQ